jgi:long-chain acyl-CoA synthetase
MEAAAPRAPADRSTGSTTIADLLPLAVERYGDHPAQRFKRDAAWQDRSFKEVGEIVSEFARGLIGLGLEPGDRVALLSTTRAEWTLCDFAVTCAGGVVVPVYATNSPEECEWVVGNSESRVVVCEDAAQVAKIVAVRERLPALEHVVVIEPEGAHEDAIAVEALRERGRERDPEEVAARTRAVTPDDPYTFIYTSGTTGPPKGCVLTHGNYRTMCSMVEAESILGRDADDLVYLYLPLAHSYALLVQLLCVDLGITLAYFGRDPQQIVPELIEVKPTYLPSVPRIFEKIYTLVTSAADPETIRKATQVGMCVRELERAGEPVPEDLRAAFAQFDERLFSNVRNAFGGRVRQATSGAAPIAKEILEFFYAAGVPVFEGYGMTETSTAATGQHPHDFRFGTVGRALPGVEIRIADDGEVLIKGANVFHGYYKLQESGFGSVVDGWLHTGDLGSLDDDGYLTITGRKKDIIITAGGKNLTPANVENDLKQSRWVSQAIMFGDRRPYPVAIITLDMDEVAPWAQAQRIEDREPAALAEHPRVRALIQEVVDRVNARYAQVEQIKRFAILDHDLSQETGELTPTLKVKRNVVYEQYAELFDRLYDD